MEYPCHGEDERRWFTLRASSFEHDVGRYALVSHVDVTDRRLAEEAVEDYARELEDRADSLTLINRIVRHDIGNDTEVVTGYAETLEEYVDEDGREFLDRLRHRSDRVVDLAASLGQLSEAIVGDADPELEPVDPVVIVAEQARHVRRTHANTPGDLTIVEPDTPPDVAVLADDLLGSTVGNLLDNAAKHADGDVRVEVDVADDGTGIDAGEAALDRGEKGADSDGSGVGLYLVDRLVDTYGGDVQVGESDLGGTLVSVKLDSATDPA